jgi:cytochrome d ubiquinol oxidase subunit I
MAAVGAFYLLANRHGEAGRIFVRIGVIAGIAASMFQIFPSGDMHGKYMAAHQPATTAAMEALFHSTAGAPMVILGQPNMEKQTIDNPIVVNKALSFLIYGTTSAEVKGLDQFPPQDWPTNVPLLYFSYHVMAGLGTLFVAIMAVSALLLWKRALFGARWMLWILMLAFPFPYIANTAGWLTAEVGRQPWLVYGLLRTEQGFSANVSAANTLFTLLGFMGMYALLSIFVMFLLARQIRQGPEDAGRPGRGPATLSGGEA